MISSDFFVGFEVSTQLVSQLLETKFRLYINKDPYLTLVEKKNGRLLLGKNVGSVLLDDQLDGIGSNIKSLASKIGLHLDDSHSSLEIYSYTTS